MECTCSDSGGALQMCMCTAMKRKLSSSVQKLWITVPGARRAISPDSISLRIRSWQRQTRVNQRETAALRKCTIVSVTHNAFSVIRLGFEVVLVQTAVAARAMGEQARSHLCKDCLGLKWSC